MSVNKKSEWGELQDLLLALNIAAYPKNITYHYTVISKYFNKNHNWKRLIRITKFKVTNNTYNVLYQKTPTNLLDAMNYALTELKEIQN